MKRITEFLMKICFSFIYIQLRMLFIGWYGSGQFIPIPTQHNSYFFNIKCKAELFLLFVNNISKKKKLRFLKMTKLWIIIFFCHNTNFTWTIELLLIFTHFILIKKNCCCGIKNGSSKNSSMAFTMYETNRN